MGVYTINSVRNQTASKHHSLGLISYKIKQLSFYPKDNRNACKNA